MRMFFKDLHNITDTATDVVLLSALILILPITIIQCFFDISFANGIGRICALLFFTIYMIGLIIVICDKIYIRYIYNISKKLHHFFPDVFIGEVMDVIELQQKEENPDAVRPASIHTNKIPYRYRKLIWQRCAKKHKSLVKGLKLPKNEKDTR